MRKWQKGVLWGASGLLVALAIGAFTLDALTDSAHLKDIARDNVKQSWSRDLTVGDVALDMFPYPRLHATGVAISNPDWAQDKYFLEAADVTAQLALIPLLTGKIVVKGVYFEGLKANLEVAKDGRRNWDLPKDASQAQKPSLSLSRLALTALEAKNSTIVYRAPNAEPTMWQAESVVADGDDGLQNIAFDIRLKRDNHALQLDGKLADLSELGTPGAVTEGNITLKAGPATATINGKIPLDRTLQNYDIVAAIDAASMQEIFDFLNIKRRSPVALKASVAMRTVNKKTEVSDFRLAMGRLHVSGTGQLDRTGAKPVFNARLQADRVDMVQTFLDAGRAPLPPKPQGELFRDEPLAWPLLVSLDGTEGKVEATIASLKLRSGIEVTDATAGIAFNDDRMTVGAFSGKLLGGAASGDAVLEGRKKTVQLNLQLKDTSLGRWFKETGKNIALTGGPMKVDAKITTTGSSMKELAAAVTGPIDIQVGPSKVLSPKAGNAEFWFTGLFSAKDSSQVDLSCVSARLPFESGVARGEGIAGARSDASQLLTSGMVDLREQTVDLRGRVRARSGISLGISTFAGDVKIVGRIAKPQLNMDEAGVVGAIARVGAAILTAGASIVVTSIWDGANPESDPCQVVFSPKAKTAKGTPKRKSAD